jgi:hypothetical protein
MFVWVCVCADLSRSESLSGVKGTYKGNIQREHTKGTLHIMEEEGEIRKRGIHGSVSGGSRRQGFG